MKKTIAGPNGGTLVDMTVDEIAELNAVREAAEEADAKAEISRKIAELEKMKAPVDLDAQIAALRAQL